MRRCKAHADGAGFGKCLAEFDTGGAVGLEPCGADQYVDGKLAAIGDF